MNASADRPQEFLSQPQFEGRDTRPYVVDINNELIDLFGKQGVVFKNDPTKSIGFLFAGRQHDRWQHLRRSRVHRRTEEHVRERSVPDACSVRERTN